jgi:hypothetical protein
MVAGAAKKISGLFGVLFSGGRIFQGVIVCSTQWTGNLKGIGFHILILYPRKPQSEKCKRAAKYLFFGDFGFAQGAIEKDNRNFRNPRVSFLRPE